MKEYIPNILLKSKYKTNYTDGEKKKLEEVVKIYEEIASIYEKMHRELGEAINKLIGLPTNITNNPTPEELQKIAETYWENYEKIKEIEKKLMDDIRAKYLPEISKLKRKIEDILKR